MTKIHRFSTYQHEISFNSSQEDFSRFKADFYSSKLGKIYQAIPWSSLVSSFALEEHRKGPTSIFSPQGKIALMFLKHYACCSDEDLMEQLNANIYYQFFCDIYLPIGSRLKNFKIISEIRCELASKLDIAETQKTLSHHWKPYLKDPSCAVTDATCYESAVRYPTNQKLLWESVDWTYQQLCLLCQLTGSKMPRNKFIKWAKRYHLYARKRRKPKKEKRAITRAFLHLLEKFDVELLKLEQLLACPLLPKYYRQRAVIQKITEQQTLLFYQEEKPQDRIVSLAKPYLRPIVRGKEVKSVEFGAKVNKVMVDGIGFIEHISFDAFNEGTRFKSSVFYTQQLTGKKLKIMGADAIYATNANRKFATKNNIRTDFVRKGRAGKYEDDRIQLAKQIKKERGSALEGSFGKDKMHYYLQNIKARTEPTEKLWIFFGIHTANALEIGRRMTAESQLQVA